MMDNVRRIADAQALRAAMEMFGEEGDVSAFLPGGEDGDHIELLGHTAGGVPIYEGPERADPEPAAAAPASLWEKFRPRLAEAMDPALYTIEWLEGELRAGKVQFWPGKEAACVTRVVTHPGGARVLQFEWGCGDLPELLAMLGGIEAFARVSGCQRLTLEGRPGWQRILKAAGFGAFSVTMVKEL